MWFSKRVFVGCALCCGVIAGIIGLSRISPAQQPAAGAVQQDDTKSDATAQTPTAVRGGRGARRRRPVQDLDSAVPAVVAVDSGNSPICKPHSPSKSSPRATRTTTSESPPTSSLN